MIRHVFALLIFSSALACTLAGCKGLGDITATGGGTNPSPTGSPTATPSAAPCRTIDPSPNLVVVGISSQIAETSLAAPFKSIAGYSVGAGGSYAPSAELIEKTASGAPITTNNVLQFTNLESIYSPTNHSAVGFPGNSFPAEPYDFPSPAASPTNTTIGNGFWSTGRIATNTTGKQCYSQAFTLKRGVYFFGDLDYYNTATSFRDALIVGTPSPQSVRRRR